VVGNESAGFSDIIKGFKERYPDYKNTDIRITNFSSYDDYVKTVINVFADGNSPDIFVVNNDGGEVLESKVTAIPSTVMSSDEFSKQYANVFDDLLIQQEDPNNKEAQKQQFIKGIPLGFETLGVFYNRKIVHSAPTTWAEVDKAVADNTDKEFTYLGIGYGGRYIFETGDLLAALLLQNGIDTYTKMGDSSGLNALTTYQAYGTDENNHGKALGEEMESLNLNTVDEFVRGKIGMMIGFPSLLRQVQLSVKRASGNSFLNEKFLRTAPMLQLTDEKGKNLLRYYYFAVSRLSQNQEMGMKFVKYLSQKEAQTAYSKSFPYLLPAQQIILDEYLKKDLSIDKDFTGAKYKNFFVDGVEYATFQKGIRQEFDDYFSSTLDRSGVPAKDTLSNGVTYVTCHKNHLVDGIEFDVACIK